MGRFDPKRRKVFLDEYREHGAILLACRAAGIDRNTPATYGRKHPEFAEEMRLAADEHLESLEKVSRTRAKGWWEPVVVREKDLATGEIINKVIDHRWVYSDRMMDTQLKALDPAKYRENILVPLVGPPSVLVVPADISPEDFVAKLRADNAKKTESPVDRRKRERKAKK